MSAERKEFADVLMDNLKGNKMEGFFGASLTKPEIDAKNALIQKIQSIQKPVDEKDQKQKDQYQKNLQKVVLETYMDVYLHEADKKSTLRRKLEEAIEATTKTTGNTMLFLAEGVADEKKADKYKDARIFNAINGKDFNKELSEEIIARLFKYAVDEGVLNQRKDVFIKCMKALERMGTEAKKQWNILVGKLEDQVYPASKTTVREFNCLGLRVESGMVMKEKKQDQQGQTLSGMYDNASKHQRAISDYQLSVALKGS